MSTVKVRIAVVVDCEGNWSCDGGTFRHIDGDRELLRSCADGHEQPLSCFFVTAELPVPSQDVPEISGRLTAANGRR